MRSSLFVSILALLFTGCVSIKPSELKPLTFDVKQVTTFGPRDFSGVTLFKASLDIKKHHLSGLLIIKRMDSSGDEGKPDSAIHPVFRIVFSNEIGMTFFDLELKSDSFKVISCFESLNKSALMKIFETDFRLLTGIDPLKTKTFYTQTSTKNLVISCNAGRYKTWQTYSPSGDTIFIKAGKSTIADNAIISYRKYANGFPTKITIENNFIGMILSMRLLDRKPPTIAKPN